MAQYILYSRRLSWSAAPNRLSEAITDLRRSGRALLDLSISNPTQAGLVYPHSEIAAALGRIKTFAYNPDARGLAEARAAVAQDYFSRSVRVAPDRILLTASTSEAYGHLFKLLCDVGDEILIPLPSYPLFEFLASLENVRAVPYHLRYDGNWHVDIASLEGKLSSRTRAIVVVNPNNPTGSVLKRDEAAQLASVAQNRGVAIISDEVFLDYPLRPSRDVLNTFIGTTDALTFSLGGLSKSAGMPQVKLGWIVVNGLEPAVRKATERLELILDTYLSVNTPVALALPDLLGAGKAVREQIQRRIADNYEALRELLNDSPAGALPAEAGWSAIVQLPRTRPEEEWALSLLREENVITQPGYFFDMPSEAFLVVSLITPPDIFREGIRRLAALLSRSGHVGGEC